MQFQSQNKICVQYICYNEYLDTIHDALQSIYMKNIRILYIVYSNVIASVNQTSIQVEQTSGCEHNSNEIKNNNGATGFIEKKFLLIWKNLIWFVIHK